MKFFFSISLILLYLCASTGLRFDIDTCCNVVAALHWSEAEHPVEKRTCSKVSSCCSSNKSAKECPVTPIVIETEDDFWSASSFEYSVTPGSIDLAVTGILLGNLAELRDEAWSSLKDRAPPPPSWPALYQTFCAQLTYG